MRPAAYRGRGLVHNSAVCGDENGNQAAASLTIHGQQAAGRSSRPTTIAAKEGQRGIFFIFGLFGCDGCLDGIISRACRPGAMGDITQQEYALVWPPLDVEERLIVLPTGGITAASRGTSPSSGSCTLRSAHTSCGKARVGRATPSP